MSTCETPLEGADGARLADEVFVVAILRAGLGLVDGFLRLVPEARVGHLGMYRDEEALRPVGYYENIPSGVEDAEVFVVDPMLATGGSGVQAVARLKRAGAQPAALRLPRGRAGGRGGAARRRIPTCPSPRRRSTASSTRTATSARAWATRATASSVRIAEHRPARPRRSLSADQRTRLPLPTAMRRSFALLLACLRSPWPPAGATTRRRDRRHPTKTAAPAATATAAPAGKVKVTGALGAKPKMTITPINATPPAKLVTRTCKGQGKEAKAGDTVTVQYYGALYHDGSSSTRRGTAASRSPSRSAPARSSRAGTRASRG